MSYRVVITDLEHPTIEPELQVLAAIPAQVERHDCRTEDEVIEASAQADALMVGFAPITGRVLEALPWCSVVARKIVYLDRAVRDGRAADSGYSKTSTIARPMFRLSKQTLGTVGLGRA